ncbi:MAG: AAA family ATPase [Treponema sp.]|uniref:chromosome segregation SMC family protein n=1 Tax=Treponema sp. TaxID=166 RepID=UPI0025ED52C3|nr:AAA family ATPase [Treponema sp.]MBR0496296.1 AAA family ATPase [Treponema sp.]
MFLKSLDIFGFKSFADKTHVEFADGITALLGPNGCGKSNVVDAVKWVLAENKAKNLRADTMESVIFNGTETRPPLNIAEVSLTLANENGLLKFDDADVTPSEITLKRRLYRSGENEYYINNKQVGATAVRRLFMDTGVGKAAYSVMEQGKIDQILSSKPEDRRYLFEEAAGISRSKAEVAEAERELERTRQNLAQIEVALAENKRSYETLKVQSEKTIKYRELKEAIFNFELDIQLLKLKDFVQNQARQTQAKEEIAEKRNAVQAEIDEILNTLTENSDKIKELQAKMGELQMELVRIQTEKTNKLDQQKLLNEQARTNREKIGTLELKQRSIQERIDEINEEIADQDADLHSKTKQIEEVKQNIESFVQNINTSQNQISTNEQKVSESETEIKNLDTERENFQKELEAITEDIVTELDAKLKDSGFSSAASKKAKEDLDSLVGKLKVYAEGRRNIFTDYASLKGHSDDENENFAKDAIKALDEVASLVKEIEGAVQNYASTTPNFIDEFLSPEGIITKKRNIDRNIQENLQKIATIRERIDGYKAENILLIGKINEYKETLGQLRVSEAQMQQQIFNAKQTAELLKRNLTSEQNALRQNEQDLYLEQKNQEDLEERLSDLDEALGDIERRGRECAETMGNLDEEIKRCNTSVSGKKNALDKKREEQQKYQSQYEKLTLDLVTSENDIRNIKQNFIETHSRDLMEFEERMYKINTPSVVLREKLSDSRKALADLGSVNLMAPEEFGEQKERYEKLQASFDDTNKSLENLLRVSEEIKSKSTEMFISTYNKIKKNFHNMFRRLFNGGRGELRLTDPQNVLTSGIDIYAEPPGKKLQNIALLSGGEKTMTAVALLFATYQVRPSPFCLLDEIDAALDDKNVTSFVTALRSFAKLSQYIVITHNKKTVMGASTMLGVTMQESGVSKIITISLEKDISTDTTYDTTEEFVEEDVPVEEGVVIPPRPEKRIHNPDGTITDPVIEKYNEEQKEAAKRARAEAKAQKEAEKAAAEAEAEKSSVTEEAEKPQEA